MKRFLVFLLVLVFSAAAALAEPLAVLEDYTIEETLLFDEEDPSAGSLTYTLRYPHVDTEAEGGADIDAFYLEQLDYLEGFTIPMLDVEPGFEATTDVSYQVTCNNDEWFSVLVREERIEPERTRLIYTGHVFSRKNGRPGYTCALPHVIGLLDITESDEMVEEYQTEKLDSLLISMVYAKLQESGVCDPDFTEEELSYCFYPEQDFYLNGDGDPVFFLQPGTAAPEEEGVLTFTVTLEEIDDEL